MNASELLKQKREDILRIASLHGATNVRVFGSAARSEDTESSDIDILVSMDESRSLMDQAALTVDLQELLGKKVDIVTEDSIYWLVRSKILKESQRL